MDNTNVKVFNIYLREILIDIVTTSHEIKEDVVISVLCLFVLPCLVMVIPIAVDMYIRFAVIHSCHDELRFEWMITTLFLALH